jgi:pyruvate,water dikinase
LADKISAALSKLDIDDVTELARVGKEIRQWIIDTPFPAKLDEDIKTAWDKMVADSGGADISVAVRSSATAEDLPDASFAGQQETFLNIRGLENVKDAMKHVFASCTTTAPFPIAYTKALPTMLWPCPPVYSAWCVPTRVLLV